MKKSLFTLALALFCLANLAIAADPAYENAMKKQIAAMRSIQTAEESQVVTNGFMRIAEAKPEEWLPLYYAAYLQTVAAFRFEVNKDQYFDQAMELVTKADKIAQNNSEITALKGYVIMGKLSVDPMNRGQEMSPLAMQTFGKAIALDKENPRATTLMAQMELGMAQFFGSGPEKACGLARVGLELFAKEESKTDENYLLPTWGKREADQIAAQCK
jgi:tetratricopeptide (TPR) repeat protein